MKKKILIGSMFVLVMILLMPSIPALQKNSIEERTKQDLQEKLESITIYNSKNSELLSKSRCVFGILMELLVIIFSTFFLFFLVVILGINPHG